MKTEEQEIKEALNFLARLDTLVARWYELESESRYRLIYVIEEQAKVEEDIRLLVLKERKGK